MHRLINLFGLLLTHLQPLLLILPFPPIRNLTPEFLQVKMDGGLLGAVVGAGVTGVGTDVVGADVGVPGVGVGALVGLGVG